MADDDVTEVQEQAPDVAPDPPAGVVNSTLAERAAARRGGRKAVQQAQVEDKVLRRSLRKRKP